MTGTDNGAQRNLAAMRLPELRKIAAEMGLKGVSALRKGDLIAAINGAQGAGTAAKATQEVKEESQPQTPPTQQRGRRRVAKNTAQINDSTESESTPAQDTQDAGEQPRKATSRRRAVRAKAEETADHSAHDVETTDVAEKADENAQNSDSEEPRYESRSAARRARRNRARREHREIKAQREADNSAEPTEEKEAAQQQENASHDNAAEERQERRRERGERRNRRNRRGRDRDRDTDTNETREDEVLQNVAGILDIIDNNVAFLRTTDYHAGPADAYVSTQVIRRFGLRAGDAVTGQVRVHNDNHQGGRGRSRQKYNPLVNVDTINGVSVEEAKARPEFAKLTPLYPNQRLRLETEKHILTTRVIDLIMPIGKGQRALIVSPPKAGKTTILQNIANAIKTNNPECYLMVVLVDERPEEVTDMKRNVKGEEVIASTFDRPPSEHTAVAELAIERAKRLVEQGRDVVVLLDSITRLGRAYNNSSPASGRILSGGVDSNALYPPKRFLGAARNIENGGSLTIIATAMVETGSAGDTVIFEEFKGTGNAELKLDRKISERRVFPAVDVNPSGTRKDELLLAPEEARIMHKLRRILSALEPQQAIDLLIKQLKKTKNNGEFLMQVATSTPMAEDNEED
ncbi:transcription termination factor Rho [Corynebacterium sp. sy017]|uniref:transcription termination factor Rho n=1 Tax=unclassified Corynebacterium TaxID=2624378 RepID=UPI00118488D0|nr:transcription termination factor Rho [Corynebacterium sp. SY003]MBP3089005.1 transcription termination factor Rho [Corynebacterium sp. sy017]TSD91327.1 transcription termination factor Rho [Corynebacterium sp. SY003]